MENKDVKTEVNIDTTEDDKELNFVEQHKKINVNLEVVSVKKHKSEIEMSE